MTDRIPKSIKINQFIDLLENNIKNIDSNLVDQIVS